ncbi:pancreatic triacylglycerol lipase-like [Artemia franciscana]|uniref:pancreatic triacylglycerol lipase-like n=1 Tax=Artemia franciscana TaxID=6661 RepID=UPI0032DA400B
MNILKLILLLSCIIFSFGSPAQQKASTCYENLGCFTTDYPWTSDARPNPVLPESPEIVATKFRLMKLLGDGVTLDYYLLLADDEFNYGNSGFDPSRKLIVLVHDWTHNPSASWIQKASRILLSNDDKNVIAVDWTNGAGYPYLRAVGNSQVVGAELARLVTYLSAKGVMVQDIHIIGHGLGAQVAAYLATRISGIGRITGLDPARVYYEGADPLVRLDESDAGFVDIIHSDKPRTRHVALGFATNTGSIEDFACSHLRSTEYFVDSMDLSYRCVYQAVPCVSWSAFIAGNCNQGCTSGKCSNMGYYADLETGNGTLYLKTFNNAPYCVRTLRLQLDVSLNQEKTEGRVRAIVVGENGQTPEVEITNSDILSGFILTSSVETRGAGPYALGRIIGMQVRYDEACCLGIGSTNTLDVSRGFVQATELSAVAQSTNFIGTTLKDGSWTFLTPEV